MILDSSAWYALSGLLAVGGLVGIVAVITWGKNRWGR